SRSLLLARVRSGAGAGNRWRPEFGTWVEMWHNSELTRRRPLSDEQRQLCPRTRLGSAELARHLTSVREPRKVPVVLSVLFWKSRISSATSVLAGVLPTPATREPQARLRRGIRERRCGVSTEAKNRSQQIG